MPGENVYDWSVVAADNATADSLINWAEGQARATVNNSARSELAAHAKFRNLITGAITTGGTAAAQTFVSGVGFTAVPTNMRVLLKVGITNAAGTTLNMDGIGAVAIKTQRGSDLVGGEMMLGSYAELIYNGTNWVLITSVAAAVRTVQKFTGGSGTYTTPAGVKWIELEIVGGGGGGAGANPASSPTNGGASCWNTAGPACTTPVYSAGGGLGGSSGGSVSGSAAPYLGISGGNGCIGSPSDMTDHHGVGGNGADSYFGGGGRGVLANTGGSAVANTGSGGAGGAINVGNTGFNSATGGGAGAYLRAIITQPAATYTYAVGASGGGGGGSGGGQSGGNGAAGMIIVHEFY